jgi:PIN domain nuclease of toxin-antitoxin system
VSAPVLDASALLAYLRDEPGAEEVSDAIAAGATLSSVNLAEVLSAAANRGADATKLAAQLSERGLLNGAITIEPFTAADAIEAGRLRPLTRDAGLSLGDRACLALARHLETRVLTADTTWASLKLGVDLVQIRSTNRPARGSETSEPGVHC